MLVRSTRRVGMHVQGQKIIIEDFELWTEAKTLKSFPGDAAVAVDRRRGDNGLQGGWDWRCCR